MQVVHYTLTVRVAGLQNNTDQSFDKDCMQSTLVRNIPIELEPKYFASNELELSIIRTTHCVINSNSSKQA